MGTNLARQALYGLFAFLLVAPATFGPQHHGVVRALLRSRVMAALGVVSYGIYLWHEAAITLLQRWTGDALFTMPWPQMFAGTLGLSVVAGALSYWLIERPLQAKRRSLPAGLSPPSPPNALRSDGSLGQLIPRPARAGPDS